MSQEQTPLEAAETAIREYAQIVDELRARVRELERIPDWLSEFYEMNGYVPYP